MNTIKVLALRNEQHSVAEVWTRQNNRDTKLVMQSTRPAKHGVMELFVICGSSHLLQAQLCQNSILEAALAKCYGM